jgi:YegS/Rv2252/BmrU family lipid kinase
MRNLLYIVNPVSGTSNKQSLKEVITARTLAAGIKFDIYPSVANGDYSFLDELITEKNYTDIIIAGGDGTVNGSINALRTHNLPFGILPSGSGNGLAFSAGIPRSTLNALNVVFRGKSEWTDGFLINNQFACMLCGLGFDAQVAHDFSKGTKRGLMNYAKKVMQHFFSSVTYPFVLKMGANELQAEAYFLSIANSNQFGNHFTIAPHASLTDGLLDIVIMTRQSRLNVIIQTLLQVAGFNRLQKIESLNSRLGVVYFQTNEISIVNKGFAPLHIDGEPVESIEHLDIKILPQNFRLIYP